MPGVGRIPFPAYRGSKPYLFISYAHRDSGIVFPEIKRFNEQGYHVWYDEGISPGNEWTDEIANALSGCALFVVMITPNSVASRNVQNEINFAIDEKKPFVAIHLVETSLQGGLKLQIGTKQAILKHNMTEDEYVYKYTSAFERLGMGTGNAPVASAASHSASSAPQPFVSPVKAAQFAQAVAELSGAGYMRSRRRAARAQAGRPTRETRRSTKRTSICSYGPAGMTRGSKDTAVSTPVCAYPAARFTSTQTPLATTTPLRKSPYPQAWTGSKKTRFSTVRILR